MLCLRAWLFLCFCHFDVLENVADGCFEDFQEGAVGVREFVLGAFDVADLGAGVVVGNGDGANGAGGQVDVLAVHVAVEEGDVVVAADEFFDGFELVGAENDVWRHAFEDVADAAVVFDEFCAKGDIGLFHGFFDGDAVGVPVRRFGADVEHKLVFEERRKTQLWAFDVG